MPGAAGEQSPARDAGGWRFIVRALEHRNYRLFFMGQGTSLIGTWLTRVATGWLVYRLTSSAWLLGIITFCGQIPTFVLTPFAGVMVDRGDRRRILIVTQVLSMLQSFALAALAIPHLITVWEVAALQLFQGVINAFDTPARQSFVVEMLESREDLPNAIALNSSMVNGARLLGPSVAGVLISAVGEGGCFLIDGFSYVAVVGSLLAMQIRPRARAAKQARPVLGELRQGFEYVSRFAPVRAILLLLALVSLMGMPYTVLMPVMATQVLHGGPNALGFLMAATGVGALVGALFLASRKSVLGLGKTIVIAAATFGAGLIAFASSHVLWLSLPLLLVVGFGMMVEMAASNTLLQTMVDEEMRGRLMSFYTMAFMGTAPFGSLLAGALASRIGAQWTIAFGGIACLVGAAFFAVRLPALRALVRPIYVRLGILPVIAEGLQSEAELTQPSRT